MAGGKITRIALKGSKTDVGGDFNGFYKRLSMTAGDNNAFNAKVTNHGQPKEPELKNGFFVKGWWSSDIEGNNKITEAIIDDTVYFHIETRNIPNGKPIGTMLYDDDVKRATEERDSSNGSDKIKLGHKDRDDFRFLNYREVQNNKVVINITLGGLLANMIAEEEDKTVELFFACSYEGQNTELPIAFADYLKVKAMPKIIFVNGHWNRIAYKIGMSPGSGGVGYWKFFTGNVKSFKDSADNYFGIISSENPYYIDGSSFAGGTESGSQRKIRGYNYAKQHFNEIIKGLGGNEIYLISHSEGGACAAGVAQYLIEKGIKIGESIMLSTDEGDEFSVEGNYPAYQVVAGYLTKDLISRKSIFVIDPVVKDNMIEGVSRYGVYISNSGLTTVHGTTIDVKVFDLIKSLKSISIEPAWNSKGTIVYQTNPKDENWAKIDEYILYNRKVDLYPKRNSNMVELYFERED